MNNLLISIIMPVYNAEKWIINAVQAIQNQTYKFWELILIDDGSVDETLKLCKECSKLDERITVYSQENKGPSAARNLGLSKITGEYFILVDCDDLLPKNALEIYINAARDYKADTVVGGFKKNNILTGKNTTTKIREKIIFNVSKNLNIPEVELLLESGLMASNWNKMYTNKLSHLRFNDNLSINEDVLYSLEALYQSSKVVVIPEIVYEYKIQNTNSVSLKFHEELPVAIDCLESVLCRTRDDKLRDGIVKWLMNYLYVQLSIISNLEIPYVEKKGYINDIVKGNVFKKYGKVKYADTNNRKVANILLRLHCDYWYLQIMKMRK